MPETPRSNQPDDTVSAFAADLRVLRTEAGNPTLAALTSLTGISKSVISDAFAGKKLPTENTTTLLSDALGGDRSAWVERRNRLAPRTTPAQTSVRPIRKKRSVSVGVAAVVAGASAVLAACVTSLVWALAILPPAVEAAMPEPSETSTYLAHADGVDPMQTVCREDAVIAASEERLDGDVLVQMMYSNECMAVWGRVTRYDGNAAGDSLSMLIYPAIDLESSRNQERSAFDVQSIYTTLMIEPDVDARVCGIATITQNGETIELGPPMCI